MHFFTLTVFRADDRKAMRMFSGRDEFQPSVLLTSLQTATNPSFGLTLQASPACQTAVSLPNDFTF